MYQGCITDSVVELQPQARMLYVSSYPTNQDLGLGAFLRNVPLWFSYPVPVGWIIQLWQLTCLAFMSQLTNQGVSYLGRSWELHLYLTPIQNGNFIQTFFGLVPSYTPSPWAAVLLTSGPLKPTEVTEVAA